MARRSKKSEPLPLYEALSECLRKVPNILQEKDIRLQVRALVEAHYLLRDLGSSLISDVFATTARGRILSYLKSNVGLVVHGDELMVVSGISEYARRIRELRVEHGWQIISGNTLKDMQEDKEAEEAQDSPPMKPDDYMLMSAQQDEDAARRWKIAKEIRNDRTLSVLNKILAYLKQSVGQPVSGEELKYLAKDKSEWARRVRELRTEHGWSVVTKATGRPDLPVGVYLLEDLRQAPEHDRHIKDDVRRHVLRRDDYTCQDCVWSRKIWNPDDPRHLEVHHIIMHAKGGENTAENLITLCNICHDVRHRKEKVGA